MQKVERKLRFIAPMECLAVPEVAEGPEWQYEVKLDGYRGIVIKQGNEARVYSRNGSVADWRLVQATRWDINGHVLEDLTPK